MSIVAAVAIAVALVAALVWALGGWRVRHKAWRRRLDTPPADLLRTDDGGHEPAQLNFTWMYPPT